jgi:hypothetical protein
MRRKHDAHDKEELEGVAQRLRNERPEASPLQLDQIKTSAMSRAKVGSRRGRAGARRLATAGLTIGLLAAGTGGVIADHHHGGSGGNASNTQYGGECNINNGNGNIGDKNGAGAENNACNENTYINEENNITTTTTTTGGTTINNYFSTVTVSATPTTTASSGVLGAKSTKAKTSKRHIKLHINVSRKSKLKKVTLSVNGKIVKVLKGKQASANINLVNLPCSNGTTTVTITAITASGKTVKESHTYHLCQV